MAYSLVKVVNPTDQDYTCFWDRVPQTIPAGGYLILPPELADHVAMRFARDVIIGQDALKKGFVYRDIVNETKVDEVKKTLIQPYGNDAVAARPDTYVFTSELDRRAPVAIPTEAELRTEAQRENPTHARMAELEAKKMAELNEIAKDLGIKAEFGVTKANLIKSILEKEI